MSRSVAVSIDNNFSGGFVSQATALNFPENACTSTDNCVFSERGFVTRRPGFDLEPNFTVKTIDRTASVVNTWLWENVAGDGTLNFAVVQIGATLYFYDTGGASGVSVGALTSTISLTPFSPAGAPSPATLECQFSAGMGFLFVSHPNLESFSVSYDPVGLTFTATAINLQIRDFKGLAEIIAPDGRPVALTTTHQYNIQNQSWAFNTAYYATFKTNIGGYPSNADIWWAYKNTSDVFDTAQVANVSLGNSLAPKGHYIVNPFNVDRSTASGVAGIAVETTGFQRPSTNAFFAGRVFYAGVAALGFNSRIYFSQICTSSAQFGLCHQSNDPTAESAFDLLSSDGGVIQIPDAGTIIKLIAIEGALIAFCTNGCWSISGSTGIGFAANDYTVRKISAIRAISSSSFVSVAGYPAWWNADGIYALGSANGQLAVNSMTDQKIKDWFADIPLSSKQQAKGTYNSLTHIIQWQYRSVPASTVEQTEQFDHFLSFNVLSGAFYPWSIPASSVQLHNALVVQGGAGQITLNNIQSAGGANQVIDSLGNQVVTYTIANVVIHPVTKYLVSFSNGAGSYSFTWAECSDTINYLDWSSKTAVDFTSYFVSGYKILGEGQRKVQGNYVYVYSDNSVPSRYLFSGVFDFANTSLSNHFTTHQTISTAQNIVTTGQLYDYAHRKLKVRGQGVALQLRFGSVTGQPFKIVGWSIWVTGNSSI